MKATLAEIQARAGKPGEPEIVPARKKAKGRPYYAHCGGISKKSGKRVGQYHRWQWDVCIWCGRTRDQVKRWAA